ncbi:MAG: carotenoid oxygenase family protein [Kofleriaceae bacterium]
MNVHEVGRLPDRLPADDDHPYRTGAWRPTFVEYDADELDVIEGAIPPELAGVYLRNTENPVMGSIGRYHPFDGDGMLHAIRFAGGRASYRNRFVRTAGLAAELEAGAPQWAGIIEAPAKSLRDGWGARGRMKDASSTDVIVHAGHALTTFYQCGDAYQHDPITLAQQGPATWVPPRGVSAHTKLDPATGELIYFGYATEAPYLWWGIVDGNGRRTHHADVDLPGPRLPHDIAFTEHYVVLNDLPLFWDPDGIGKGAYRPRWKPELGSRFAVIPRAGGEPRWFEAAPTYVLHWINAYEDGNTIVLDGYFQSDPMSRPDPADGPYGPLKKMVDVYSMQARPHRWRLDLATGTCREERLFEAISEFPSIHYARAGTRHRYAWSMTAKPGWFLFDGMVRMDMDTGSEQRWQYPDGVYASEAPMAPRAGASAEDDGWLVTFVTDTVHDRSECHLFDAARIADGPTARIALPARICVGTHACWSPA